jgi:hypothetical protein
MASLSILGQGITESLVEPEIDNPKGQGFANLLALGQCQKVVKRKVGALLAFLNGIGNHWNISLFHYRNHGSDYGRVLVGVQAPEE